MRWLKRCVLALLLVVIVWIGLLESHVMPIPTATERTALAVMAAPANVPKGDHDAFATMWLSEYDVPAADVDKVVAKDVDYYHTIHRDSRPQDNAYFSFAEGKYHKDILPADPASCGNDDDCLALVRAHLEASRAFVASHGLLLAHAQALAAADHLHWPFAHADAAPLPPWAGPMRVQLTDAAVQFASGNSNDGLARACTAANTARMLATRSDELEIQLGATRIYRSAAALAANMLAEIPGTTALPDACAKAFVPIADADLNLCDSLKNDFYAVDTALPDFWLARTGGAHAAVLRMLLNRRALKAIYAVQYAEACSTDPAIAADAHRMAAAGSMPIDGWQGLAFDLTGEAIASADLVFSVEENLQWKHDTQATSRIMAAALAMRAPAATGTATPPVLPAGITLDPRQHLLKVALVSKHGNGGKKELEIPVPGSRVH